MPATKNPEVTDSKDHNWNVRDIEFSGVGDCVGGGVSPSGRLVALGCNSGGHCVLFSTGTKQQDFHALQILQLKKYVGGMLFCVRFSSDDRLCIVSGDHGACALLLNKIDFKTLIPRFQKQKPPNIIPSDSQKKNKNPSDAYLCISRRNLKKAVELTASKTTNNILSCDINSSTRIACWANGSSGKISWAEMVIEERELAEGEEEEAQNYDEDDEDDERYSGGGGTEEDEEEEEDQYEDEIPEEWTCPRCTLINKGASKVCEVCDGPRIKLNRVLKEKFKKKQEEQEAGKKEEEKLKNEEAAEPAAEKKKKERRVVETLKAIPLREFSGLPSPSVVALPDQQFLKTLREKHPLYFLNNLSSSSSSSSSSGESGSLTTTTAASSTSATSSTSSPIQECLLVAMNHDGRAVVVRVNISALRSKHSSEADCFNQLSEVKCTNYSSVIQARWVASPSRALVGFAGRADKNYEFTEEERAERKKKGQPLEVRNWGALLLDIDDEKGARFVVHETRQEAYDLAFDASATMMVAAGSGSPIYGVDLIANKTIEKEKLPSGTSSNWCVAICNSFLVCGGSSKLKVIELPFAEKKWNQRKIIFQIENFSKSETWQQFSGVWNCRVLVALYLNPFGF